MSIGVFHSKTTTKTSTGTAQSVTLAPGTVGVEVRVPIWNPATGAAQVTGVNCVTVKIDGTALALGTDCRTLTSGDSWYIPVGVGLDPTRALSYITPTSATAAFFEITEYAGVQ